MKLTISQENKIKKDIETITKVLKNNNYEEIKECYNNVDNTYTDLFKSIDIYESALFGIIEPDFEYYLSLLKRYKSKLEGFLCFSDLYIDKSSNSININNDNTNTNNNTVNLSFEQLIKTIEDMPGLTDKDTEEIKEKLKETKIILKENTNKKKKWEKLKPIFIFLMDKGVDVVIAAFPYIINYLHTL